MSHNLIAGRNMCLTQNADFERCQCMCEKCWIQWLAEDVRTWKRSKILVGRCVCGPCPDSTPLAEARTS